MASFVREDLTGRVFGRLTVFGKAPTEKRSASQRSKWFCRCECGNERVVLGQNLRNGNSTSCGCWNREAAAQRTTARNTTHGLSHLPEYLIWGSMVQRCENPNSDHYPSYGGRGIRVCEEWRADFGAFYRDMGPRPSSEHSIDRIDNDADYRPGNCRWATRTEQATNQRKTLRADGAAGSKAIAEKLGITPNTLRHRRWKRMPDALTTPLIRPARPRGSKHPSR